MRSLLLRTSTRYATAILSPSKTTASIYPVVLRSFATARTDLLAAVKKEHQEELNEGRTEMSEDLTYLLETVRKNAWRVVDEAGFTKMHRNNNSMKIRLSFHCQDLIQEPQQAEGGDEDEDSPPEEEEQDFGEAPGSLRFTATATPTKTGKTLIFQCTSEFGSARIDAVSVGEGEDDVDKLHTEDANYNEYVGPAFDELDEKLRQEFERFLEIDVGIDTDLATFINKYADYKEQMQYVNFLKDCQKVLE
jgi:succinate dehydrogenase flavin-adding protein (antitoxin of CptAB toxin-antitoxin module)